MRHFCLLLAFFGFFTLSVAGSWEVQGDALIYNGEKLYPIDEDGVYYTLWDDTLPYPRPKLRISTKEIVEKYGVHNIVRCRPVDFVDCSTTSHNFIDDGLSRVITLAGEPYRVTWYQGKLSWFAYYLRTRESLDRPHLLVAQLINDQERETTLTLTFAHYSTWAAPYRAEEYYIPRSQEPPQTVYCDVGVGVYTGREIPVDGKPYNFSFLFYPKMKWVKLTVSHHPATLIADDKSGAAVSKVWVFEVLDDLRIKTPPMGELPENQRLVGIFLSHPWYFYNHFGMPSRTKAQRIKSLQALVDNLRFSGMNYLEFFIVNGSDIAGCAWYDSKYFESNQGNLLEELLPLTDKAGIKVVPALAVIRVPDPEAGGEYTETPDPNGFSIYSMQFEAGKGTAKGLHGTRVPDPLRPEVQEYVLNILKEILDRAADHPSLFGVGFRVNGALGLCYLSERHGYSHWDISEFEKDTGIDVPDNADAYRWLRENAWDKWIDWRCKRMRDFWLRARDLVVSYRPDLKLVIKTVLPVNSGRWADGGDPIEMMKEHGYDPALYVNEEGIIIERSMYISSDRYATGWSEKAWAVKDMYYDKRLVPAFQTREGQAVEFYHGYWEEVPHPDNEFGDVLRTATTAPFGAYFYEAANYMLAETNSRIQVFFGWERPNLGHEDDLQRYCRAFRALPYTEGRPFTGKVEARGKVWVRWFGGRLAVLNREGLPQKVRLYFDKKENIASAFDFARFKEVPVACTPQGCYIDLDLDGFELRTLKFSKAQ